MTLNLRRSYLEKICNNNQVKNDLFCDTGVTRAAIRHDTLKPESTLPL